MLVFVCISLCAVLGHVSALSTGAPLSACPAMRPLHAGGVIQDNEASPYNVTLSTYSVPPGGYINVVINTDITYRGIFLQARTGAFAQALGTWRAPEGDLYQTRACFNRENSAVTHTSSAEKGPDYTFTWLVPEDIEVGIENLNIYVTIVRTLTVIYLQLQSVPIQIVEPATTVPEMGGAITDPVTVPAEAMGVTEPSMVESTTSSANILQTSTATLWIPILAFLYYYFAAPKVERNE